MKRGLQTSELWLTVAIIVGEVTAALAGAVPAKWAAVLVVASGAAYKIARGLSKLGGAEAFGQLAAGESTSDPHANG